MIKPEFTGNAIRQTFIQFFKDRGHTFVPSASLVPGDDPTLLFTNAGMVQFKEVFLGTDKRPYTRVANSQKCMRVSGKHNDLEEVGFDDTHHTFFEMLGNWSFGDYYKKEAIAWAWELLTEVWGLPKDRFWATCFEDEKGKIPRDDEAANYWKQQPGFHPDHVLFFGRKDNFWEMAETGPCGPCSEIHYDRGPQYCNKQDDPNHTCQVNGDCQRFLELWNLVFIQYNRTSETHLDPLPATHVDTGMGLERIVSVLQNVDSNYKTDLLSPLLDTVQSLTGHTSEERAANITPYRVIADHARAATFLIADGVVPGNTGRNYVCRMIIRRAARFGGKIGLHKPFLAKVASMVIQIYGDAYPELKRHQALILETLTREESRFQRTVEGGTALLESLLDELELRGVHHLDGVQAFDLYATYGLPLEITRDIAREHGLDVDEAGFHQAMEQHRLASGAGKALGEIDNREADLYRQILSQLQQEDSLSPEGVTYDPYTSLEVEGPVLALVRDGQQVNQAQVGDSIAVVLPKTCFYVESGGQVSDTGTITSLTAPGWEIQVDDTRQPISGLIIHLGKVLQGSVHVGDQAVARVDVQRRRDIMCNHTATHLLHAELRATLGEHVRQAGSLVAPDRLRFDFTHPEALTPDQLAHIEAGVNRAIQEDSPVYSAFTSQKEAIAAGAIALFGEKYGETVRTISIGDPQAFSYELCGGTHLDRTGEIGIFLILNESSVGSGLRRIEAVTGRKAYELIRMRFRALEKAAALLNTTPEELPQQIRALQQELNQARKHLHSLQMALVAKAFEHHLEHPTAMIAGIPIITAQIPDADADTLRQMTDRFRQRYSTGVAVLASVQNEKPLLIAAVTKDLTERGLHAGELVKFVAKPLGGGGGGKPTLAQAGGKDASKLEQALASVPEWVQQKLKT
jgi:alanyl-tRNA synthetase